MNASNSTTDNIVFFFVSDLKIVLYSHVPYHNDTIIKTEAGRKTSLTIYVPLTLLQGFEKVVQGLNVRGSRRPNRNFNILTSTLMAVNHVSFSFSWCSTCWVLAFFTASYQHLLWTPIHKGPKPLRPGVVFPTTSRLLRLQLYCKWNSIQLLSWLRYIIVQRPLDRPLDLWNRMFDRHQAEITFMQFTGHSLPVRQSMSVPWEFFTSSHFTSQFPPMRFPLITAIRMCHLLPVHHLGMAFLAWFEGQN